VQHGVETGRPYSCFDCRAAISSTDAVQLFGAAHATARAYQAIELRSVLSGGVFVSCATKACDYVEMLPPGAAATERYPMTCKRCGQTTCTLCRSQPYHYGRTCAHAAQLRARWLTLHGMINEMQGTAAALMAEHQERLRVHEQLRADETLKARTCRLCSVCGRIIEHLEGCDTMRCGMDAHGGNVQNGCGATLAWSKLAPYQPQLPAPPTAEAVAAEFRSKRDHGPLNPCSVCGKHISAGPRFECVCCPGEWSACLDCIARAITLPQHRDHYFDMVS
jgi:hypothetical protein